MPKGKIKVNFKKMRLGFSGEDVLVGRPDRYTTIDYASIVAYAAKAAHVPESNVEMAMEALFDAVSYYVLNGHSVQIPYLGTLRFAINAKATTNEEESIDKLLRRKKIQFLPTADLRAEVNAVEVESVIDPDSRDLNLIKPVIKNTTYYYSVGGKATRKIRVDRGGWFKIAPEENEQMQVRFFGEKFTNATRMTLQVTWLNAAGVETQVTYEKRPTKKAELYIDAAIPQGTVAVTEVKLTAFNDEQVWSASNIFHVDYFNPTNAQPTILSADFIDHGGKKLNGDSVIAAEYDTIDIVFNGYKLDQVDWEAAFVDVYSMSEDSVRGRFDVGSGQTNFNVGEGMPAFWIYFSEYKQNPIVASIEANGVKVTNGATSPIEPEETYEFALRGTNLESITSTNILVPDGSGAPVILSVSPTMVVFRAPELHTGDIVIVSDDATLFSVHLVEAGETDWSITQLTEPTEVAPGVIARLEAEAIEIQFAGNNLSSITEDNVVIEGNSEIVEFEGFVDHLVMTVDFRVGNTTIYFYVGEGASRQLVFKQEFEITA